MANTLNFSSTKLWRKDFGGNPAYSIGVSSKRQDGSYVKKYLSVYFPKKLNVPKISNGSLVDLEGFLFVYEKRDGTKEYQMVVNSYKLLEEQNNLPAADDSDIPDSFEQAMEQIPF